MSERLVSIVTANLYNGNGWEDREDNIVGQLDEWDGDVICFQEAVLMSRISKQYNTAQIIRSRLGVCRYPFETSAITRLQPTSEDPNYREGLVIISKYPIATSEALVLTREEGDPHQRIMQYVVLLTGDDMNKSFELTNEHPSLFTPGPNFAKGHTKQVADLMGGRGRLPVRVGDLQESNPGEGSYWREAYYSSVDEYAASTGMLCITQPDAVGEEGELDDRSPDHILIPRATCQFVGEIALSPLDEYLTFSDHRFVKGTVQY